MGTNNEVLELAEAIRKECFPKLPELEIRFNNRLQTTLGRLVVPVRGRPFVEIIGYHRVLVDEETMINVLKHEYLHFELLRKNGKKRFGHSEEFLRRAKELRIS